MNIDPAIRSQRTAGPWLARATAVVAALSMQLLWLGILLCALECAKGECSRPAAGDSEAAGEHCGHSGAAPETPARDSHGRDCPASFLHQVSASRDAIMASQAQLAAHVVAAAVLPRAATRLTPRLAHAVPAEENSPPLTAAAASPLPLRI